ncbi:unnamed protein product [Cyprideis torosa]|uniref:RBR-type E3 ubiquitin transferase n=1 Tax=Cyprideis torosa TaxID=163714 RepID=A0A7R8WKC0_9CRUS|nr:unnamed protein product [Cyprideis torosa]CAG0896887.1 unnamed protein product [Cyprideis torosa]
MDVDDSDDSDFDDYYEPDEYTPDSVALQASGESDPEYFEFICLSLPEVDQLLSETVEALTSRISITPTLAKILLHRWGWNVDLISREFMKSPSDFLIQSHVKPDPSKVRQPPCRTGHDGFVTCAVCLLEQSRHACAGLACGELFCKSCWAMHCEVQISTGTTTGEGLGRGRITCMGDGCNIIAPEDFVLANLSQPRLRERYQVFAFRDYVNSHPQLRFCRRENCRTVIRAKESKPRKVVCSSCGEVFCFQCAEDPHAPSDCATIRQWLVKCADDSETANYISANTKDCPKCNCIIEKNGGCNHMQCSRCKNDFCWMCLGDWKNHGSEYYDCSRYKENPNIAKENELTKAREALKKYIFYYERWDNHAKSLRLEEQTLQKIKQRMEEKAMLDLQVADKEGTWIDWQYLLDAAALLAKCRYTLKYTYPYAYYMESDARKALFEFQQAQLEAEIENLSWKIERAEIYQRGDILNQMDVAEKRRSTMLKDFFCQPATAIPPSRSVR